MPTSPDTRTPVERGIVRVTSGRTGRVSYEARWSTVSAAGARVYGYKRCKTLKDARAERARRVTEVRDGTYQQPSKETVGQYAARWLDRMERTRWATSTAYARRRVWATHVAPVLDGIRLAQVSRAHCQRVIDAAVSAGYAAGTVRNVRLVLSACLHAAELDGLIPRNPARSLAMPAGRSVPKPHWTAGQARRFLDTTAGDDLHALWLLLLTAGLRIGEARALRWEHVDLAAGTVHVTDTMRRGTDGLFRPEPGTKTTKDRTIPLAPSCVAALTTYKEWQADVRRRARLWDVRGFVFADAAGRPLGDDLIRRRLDAAIRNAGLPRITLHGLRHCFTSLLIESGASVKAVSEMLGHAGVSITLDVYAHTSDAYKRGVVTGLDALTRGDDATKTGVH